MYIIFTCYSAKMFLLKGYVYCSFTQGLVVTKEITHIININCTEWFVLYLKYSMKYWFIDTFLRPILTVATVWNTEKLVTYTRFVILLLLKWEGSISPTEGGSHSLSLQTRLGTWFLVCVSIITHNMVVSTVRQLIFLSMIINFVLVYLLYYY